MNGNPSEQFFEELLPYLEQLDARIGAVVQLLKEKGMITDEEFAARVKRADMGSEVRDRGLCADGALVLSRRRVKQEKLIRHRLPAKGPSG